MSKSTIAVMLILAICAGIAGAQTVKMEWSEGSTSLDYFWRGDGYFAYALGCKQWAEAYGGVTYSPTSWADFGLGAGLEQADNPIRLGGWVWLGQGDVSFCHLFADGGSGPWHKSTLTLKVDERLSIGAIGRSFKGRGAFAEVAIGEGRSINSAIYEGGAWTFSLSQKF